MKTKTHKTVVKDGKEYRLRIFQDSFPENPREWDHSTVLILGGRYEHQDSCPDIPITRADMKRLYDEWCLRVKTECSTNLWTGEDFWNQFDSDIPFDYKGPTGRVICRVDIDTTWMLEELSDSVVVLPVYKYEHGGVCYRTYPFSCPWDSGRVGVIFAPIQEYREIYPKLSDEDLRKRIEEILISDVEVYSQWASGDVYGFSVEYRDAQACDACGRSHDWDHYDSCSGFYGNDWYENGMDAHIEDFLLPLLEDAEVEWD